MKTMLAECRQQLDSKNSARAIEKFGILQEELKDVMKWFKDFKEEQCALSKLFTYWEEYNAMVNLLLHFLQAERTGDWKLYLSAVAAMTPYFFAMDQHNYARWLPVYLADMHQIESEHPRVYVEFMRGNHVVCRSSHPFSQVSTDIASNSENYESADYQQIRSVAAAYERRSGRAMESNCVHLISRKYAWRWQGKLSPPPHSVHAVT